MRPGWYICFEDGFKLYVSCWRWFARQVYATYLRRIETGLDFCYGPSTLERKP